MDLQIAEPYAALVGPRSVASQEQEEFVGDHYLVLSPDPQRPGTSLGTHPMQGRTVPYAQPVPIASMMQNLARTQADLQATLQHTNRLTATDLPLTLREARRGLATGDPDHGTPAASDPAAGEPDRPQRQRHLRPG